MMLAGPVLIIKPNYWRIHESIYDTMNVIMQYAYEYTECLYIGPSLLMTNTDNTGITVQNVTAHITILSISIQPMAMD